MPQRKLPLSQRRMIQQGFQQHFQAAVFTNQKLTISKHAQFRMSQRRNSVINLGQIAFKANEAKKMGVNESLIITKNAALIVSTKNNMVITVMNREDATSQIFTNINGTIILDK
jgi:flagellar operon protein